MAPAALERLLCELPPAPPALEARVLAGRARNEDAAIVSLPPGQALVQTVDILAPLVDDPYQFGRIAAANALSDVYAMGGQPWCALNIACFPDALVAEQPHLLREVLRGGQDTVIEAGAVIVGGHTVNADEVKYGLAVTGIIDPARHAANDRLEVGDALVLTKPLGCGVLGVGIKARWDGWEQALEELCRWCGRLNSDGAAVIQALGLKAATDITGFGLGGHALEMAQASDKSLTIDCTALPLFSGAREFADNGLISAASHGNRAYWAPQTLVGQGVTPTQETLVFDVQTSGGLLLAVPPAALDTALGLLRERGSCAAVVGRVLPPRPDGKRLLLTA